MENPRLHKHFRSINDGFFDLSNKPIKCPVGDGYLINIITDSQYCHFTYLYLEENSHAYSIVWADDLYDGAIRADIEEFENEYKDEFDKSEIYLLDNSFEHYMYHYYQLNEEHFSSNKDMYSEPRKSYSNISNKNFNKEKSNIIHSSNIDMNSYNSAMDMSDNDTKFLYLIKFSILSFTSMVGLFVSIYSYYMQSVNFSIDGEVVSIEWPIDHQGSPIINIRGHDGKEYEFPNYRVSLTPEQIKKGDSFSKIEGLKDCKINESQIRCVE